MAKLQNISIRYKLVLMQVFTSLLVLSVFFGIFIVTEINSYKRRKQNNMLGLAQVMGTNSIPALRFQDNESAREILAELKDVAPDIIHAVIFDNKGRIFAGYARANAPGLRVPAGLREQDVLYESSHLFVRQSVTDKDEKLGYVFLESELTELEQIKRAELEMAIILTLAAIAFSFLIAVAIQTYISKRLLRLVNVMKEVSATGDYSKSISDTARDEISTLYKVFNNLMQQVMQNQQRKDEFIGIASHELKTPLTSVKGYMELLTRIEEKQPNKQLVQKALENVIKLERLIQDLLDVSRIQSGQLQLNIKEFPIDQLLQETIGNFQLITGTHEIVNDTKTISQEISADRQRIEQVLINLLSNAVKYSPSAKKVIVSSRRTPTDLVIQVRDFGIGIPADEHNKIFERFYRTKDMSKHISGFGLGLYISRDIIRRHKGRIWVESEDQGTAFFFSLPLNNN